MGSLWGHFGVTLGSLWITLDHFGSLWDALCLFGTSLGSLGVTLEHFGATLRSLEVTLGSLGKALGSLWGDLDVTLESL